LSVRCLTSSTAFHSDLLCDKQRLDGVYALLLGACFIKLTSNFLRLLVLPIMLRPEVWEMADW
jgi:hypothetical protein